MMRDLGLTESEWSWVLAAFTAGYAIFQFPGGVFGDKVGPRRALTVIAVLWTAFMVLNAIVPGQEMGPTWMILGSLMVVRFLIGAAHAPIFPTINVAINRWFPPNGRATPLGLSSTALTLGAAAASPIVVFLLINIGWRYAFLILSPLGLIVAALWWWYSRDLPSEHSGVNARELEIIGAQEIPPTTEKLYPPGWVRVLKNRNIILLTISYSCMNFVFYEVFNWFYYYLVEVRTFSESNASYVNSTQWIAGGAGAVLGGLFCDYLCKRCGVRWGSRWPIIIGMVASAGLLLAGAFHSNPLVAVSLLALCFFFNQLTESSYWATSISVGNRFAGAAGGVMNTGANLMGVANAFLVPWFAKHFGWDIALASGAGFALLGALLLFFVKADEAIEV